MDSSDILSLVIYGFAAGVLGLASPLAVEWVVTTIGFGRYLQPLIVLSILLFTFMAFSGAMRIMQAIVVELMQRRLMVRMVGDLAYRLPHVRHAALHGENGQEMMNRFLDVPTIQKALASLLLEGITLVLTTIIGMVLLAFYHPFLLGFDIVLLFCMTFVTYVLGRGGVRTAIRESITKYKIVHWLQEIISYPTAFRLQGGLQLALDRANRLSAEYVSHRREHFSVLVRQILFAVSLQAMALTALILLGGWLVLQGQLTLGQWVASELVIGVIVGAFAKIGKSIETYFDLLAAVDKVGHLLDLEPDSPSRFLPVPSSPASVRWKELEYHCEHQAPIHFGSGQIQAGARIQLKSHEGSASEFLYLLCGLRESSSGILDIDGIDAREAARLTAGRLIGMAVDISIFQGSILENVSLRRSFIGMEDVRWSLEQVGLGELLLRLPQGVETMLSSQGGWLNQEQKIRLMIARAIVSKPKLLAIDLMLDQLSVESRASIIKNLCDPSMPWTLVVVTNHDVLGSSATSHTFTDDHHTNHTHA